MLCIFQHQPSNKKIVIGNVHLEHDPEKDHLKFAQAAFFLEKAANYVSEHKGMRHSLPFICGGDYNSLPISSVLSAFYGENIESSKQGPSEWSIPATMPQAQKDLYWKVNEKLMRKA